MMKQEALPENRRSKRGWSMQPSERDATDHIHTYSRYQLDQVYPQIFCLLSCYKRRTLCLLAKTSSFPCALYPIPSGLLLLSNLLLVPQLIFFLILFYF